MLANVCKLPKILPFASSPLAAPAAAAPALPHSRVAAPALVPAPAANPSARLRRVSLPLSCSRLGGSARSRKIFMTTSGTAAASLLRGRARYACVRAVCRASLRRVLGVCVCVCLCVVSFCFAVIFSPYFSVCPNDRYRTTTPRHPPVPTTNAKISRPKQRIFAMSSALSRFSVNLLGIPTPKKALLDSGGPSLDVRHAHVVVGKCCSALY